MQHTSQQRSTTPIRIVLIDDHSVVRAGVANLLALEHDMQVVAQADNGADGIALWRRYHPDIGIVDVAMAGMDGIETVRRIRVVDPAARLVMLTSSELRADAERAHEAGAAAYITKHVAHEEILRVVRQVYAGRTGLMLGVRTRSVPEQSELLSEREFIVLRHMRRGESNAEIAASLGVSERTVKGHVTQILAKLGAPDRAGAVARGFDLGLLEVAPAVRRP
jgi:DNA-binding NarL/FixJ family response regulator